MVQVVLAAWRPVYSSTFQRDASPLTIAEWRWFSSLGCSDFEMGALGSHRVSSAWSEEKQNPPVLVGLRYDTASEAEAWVDWVLRQ